MDKGPCGRPLDRARSGTVNLPVIRSRSAMLGTVRPREKPSASSQVSSLSLWITAGLPVRLHQGSFQGIGHVSASLGSAQIDQSCPNHYGHFGKLVFRAGLPTSEVPGCSQLHRDLAAGLNGVNDHLDR